jgi:Fic-DOC domain mobile mystery protein B
VSDWEPIPDETPIDPSDIKPKWVKTRNDLAKAEAKNIAKPFTKYLASKPTEKSAPFNYEWLLRLHKEMFGDVMKSAGNCRTENLSLGIEWTQISNQLAMLIDDLHAWTGYDWPIEEQAVHLHHRAVHIHPFKNGNGRWARLLANIWLTRHGKPIVAWPDVSLDGTSARSEYITAIKTADAGQYGPLTKLHTRYMQSSE